MENDFLESIKLDFENKINDLRSKSEQLTSDFNQFVELNSKIEKFLEKYDSLKVFDFDLLDEFISYLPGNNIIKDDINYRQLYEIREDLKNNFLDRLAEIDKIFEDLINKIKIYFSNYTKEYKNKLRSKNKLDFELENYERIYELVSKIINKDLISEEEIKLLDKELDLNDSDRLKLYLYIVSNNADSLHLMVEKAKKKQNEKRTIDLLKNKDASDLKPEISEQIKTPENKDKKMQPTKAELGEFKAVEFGEDTKKLLVAAKQIIQENNATDNEFLSTLDGLLPEENIYFIDDFKNPEEKIAIILKEKILPSIEQETASEKDAKKLLSLYIDKYDEIKKSKSISYKLQSVNKAFMLETIEKVENMLQFYEKHKIDPDIINLSGYYSILQERYNDFIYSIKDDDLFNSGLYTDTYDDLIKAIDEIQIRYDVQEKDKEVEAIQSNNDFYVGANNFIIFPDGVDFNEQIDEDKTLNDSYKKKILNGLRQLSTDESILSSSRHKIKDQDEKYAKLRSFKGKDYRIIYRVSRATGLEKFYGKKMNAVFVIKVGYGSTSEKEKMYQSAKNMYDKTFDQVEKIIEVLNSDNLEAIKKITDNQLIKLDDYIKSCNAVHDKSSSIGAMGGDSDE